MFRLGRGAEVHLGSGSRGTQGVHKSVRLSFGFLYSLCAELSQQPAASGREQSQTLRIYAPTASVLNEEVVNAFEADRLVGHDFGNLVSGLIDVGIGDDQKHTFWRTLDQPTGGFQNRDACPFRADQSAGNMEGVFRKEV